MIRFDVIDRHGAVVDRGPRLPEALHVFLLDLRPCVDTNFTIIAGLDQHDDELFRGPQLHALRDAASNLAAELRARVWSGLPPLPPYLDEDVAERVPMTPERVLKFLCELADTARSSLEAGNEVKASGE